MHIRACICVCAGVCVHARLPYAVIFTIGTNKTKQNKRKSVKPTNFSLKLCVTHMKLLGVAGSYNVIPLHMLRWKLENHLVTKEIATTKAYV